MKITRNMKFSLFAVSVLALIVSLLLSSCGSSGGGGGSGGSGSDGGGGGTPPALNAPSGLLATPISTTAIDLSWNDTSSIETGFKVERGTDGATFSEIGLVSDNTTTYSDAAGLTALTTYYYRVRATDSTNDTAYSNIADATTMAPTGMSVVTAPYSSDGSALPSTAPLFAMYTHFNVKLDLGIVVDTTGSMAGTIANLKSGLTSVVFPALQARIPSIAIGVAGHDDFPYNGYGDAASGDLPFYVAGAPNGYVTTGVATAQAAVNTLVTHYGSDGPESEIPAMYHAITGAGLSWPTGAVPAATPPAGTFGALRFRSDAQAFIINLSDADFHNGKRALDTTGTSYDTAYQNPYSFATINVDQLTAQFNAYGVKFIGGAADNGARAAGYYGNPYGYMSYIADKTGSYAPPSAFTHTASCPAGYCCTGLNGAGILPDGPTVGGVQQCRMVFSYSFSGSDLNWGLINAVVAQYTNLPKSDVYVLLYNDIAESIDVVGSFVSAVEPVPAGGSDSVTGAACATFPSASLRDNFSGPKALVKTPDGVYDTISQVGGSQGLTYCFKVTPKPNTTVAPTTGTQIFKAWMRFMVIHPTGGAFVMGSDQPFYFAVPPAEL